MNHCPITWETIPTHKIYSSAGLKKLSAQLSELRPLNYSAKQQREEALARAGKMSIQGIQPKISARLNVSQRCFDIVSQQGQYILKPQSVLFPELPENEAITMSMAECISLDVPVHGLILSSDNSWTYFIKRFDRYGRHHQKRAVEDFAQLAGENRYSKYKSSMEKVSKLIQHYCTFPKIELVKLFKLTLFNYLVGNEDMHLKNFSVITNKKGIIELSPVYDLLNTTIAQKNTKEEIALPLNGKKNNLTKKDLLTYFPLELLSLNEKTTQHVCQQIQEAIPTWNTLIDKSYLSEGMKEYYHQLLSQRIARLGWSFD